MRVLRAGGTPNRLRVALGFDAGTRLGGSLVAVLFVTVGAGFAAGALPHTEILRAERRDGGFACTRAQALAGRWELFSKTRMLGPDARCELRRREDEEGVSWQAMIVSRDGRFTFGKARGNRRLVQDAADEVNRFFAGAEPSLEIRDDVFWWWLAIPGLAALGIGSLLLTWLNHRDVWVFDRAAGEAVRYTQLAGVSLFPRRRPLGDCRAAAVREERDGDGDVFHNLRLTLATGEGIDMCCSSPAGRAPERLHEAARRLSDFVAGSGPMRDRKEQEPASRGTP